MKRATVFALVAVVLSCACMTSAMSIDHLRSRAQQVPAANTVELEVATTTSTSANAATQAMATALLGTAMQTSEVMSAEDALALGDPAVAAAVNAKLPDAVDRLIQGILSGTGKGGVVTTEFTQNGVHATIISNVNELRVSTMDDSEARQRQKVDEMKRKADLRELDRQARESTRRLAQKVGAAKPAPAPATNTAAAAATPAKAPLPRLRSDREDFNGGAAEDVDADYTS